MMHIVVEYEGYTTDVMFDQGDLTVNMVDSKQQTLYNQFISRDIVRKQSPEFYVSGIYSFSQGLMNHVLQDRGIQIANTDAGH